MLKQLINSSLLNHSVFIALLYKKYSVLLNFQLFAPPTLTHSSTNNMAQSADDIMCANTKSPVAIEVYWPSLHYSPNPPKCWTAWLEGFKIALFVKHSLDYDTLLDDPTEKVAQPRFTTAPARETDEAQKTRMEANRTAQANYRQQ